MIRSFLLLFTMLPAFQLFAQSTITPPVERQAIKAVITQLFDGMRMGDTSKVRSVFMENATLASSFIGREGPVLHEGSLEQFIQSVGASQKVLDEKIWSYDINIDGTLATAWTDYTFYLGDQKHHCGVNNFVLHKTADGWKIISITDTRNKHNCRDIAINPKDTINQLLDAWHHAAATADEEMYFGSMADSSIYIGTEAGELWTKEVFEEWSKKYFERDSAWDFTATDRNIYLAENGRFAWFDELLDTWMGPCRASGVLEYRDENGWKIKHCQLSVTVPNDKIESFIELLKKE